MLTASYPMTFATVATALVQVGIRCVERVAFLAMSFGAVVSVQSLSGIASQNVFTNRDRLKMVGSHAAAVSTAASLNVIQRHRLTDHCNFRFIQPPMGLYGSTFKPKDSVSIRVDMADPEDFAVRSTRIDLRPKALFGGQKPPIVRCCHGAYGINYSSVR